MFRTVAMVLLIAATPAAAQVQMRPTDPPLVTAANESWYVQREPIQFAGELYFPAGAAVFFDGNTMARTGHYNGVPLYMDTTLEPYSVLLVPVRRGLMQPYERRRQGDLVGTTGSRTPSFPVRVSGAAIGGRTVAQAPVSPTQPQQPIGALGVFTPGATTDSDTRHPGSVAAPAPANNHNAPTATGTSGRLSGSRQNGPTNVSILRPENNDGVWIEFKGEKWVSAGTAIPLRASEFKMIGQYSGFPVFMRNVQGVVEGDRIYLPTRAGLVAPYKPK
jgi:hypothetical protein